MFTEILQPISVDHNFNHLGRAWMLIHGVLTSSDPGNASNCLAAGIVEAVLRGHSPTASYTTASTTNSFVISSCQDREEGLHSRSHAACPPPPVVAETYPWSQVTHDPTILFESCCGIMEGWGITCAS